MKQVLLSISDSKKAQALLAFLKQVDFVQVKETDKYLEMAKIEADIAESLNDFKKGNIIPWKGKKVTLTPKAI